jgi:hypothetical protein
MGKGSSTTTKESGTQQVQLPQWMSDAGQSLYNKANTDSAAHPVAAYNGQLTAPTSGNQQAASQQAAANAGVGQDQVAAGQAAIQGSLGQGDRVTADSFDKSDASRYMSPYVDNVQNRVVSDMMRNGTIQLQELGDSAAANHAYGGTREAVAQGEATKGINNNILDYLARSQEAAFENAQGQFNTDADRAQSAATTNAGLSQAELDRGVAAGAALGNLGQQASGINAEGINNLLKTGTVDQQAQDAADQAQYQEYLRMQDGDINRDEDLMAILAGTPRNVTTNTTGKSSQTSNPGWLNTALGVGGMAASIYSDERLKRDIVQVGQHGDGLPIV